MSDERPRRLAAVWFADILGYTSLCSENEELGLRVVQELQRTSRRQCEVHGGRVAKLIGDAVVAAFDSVDGAVRAAVTVRDDFLASEKARESGVSVRIGLHLGGVVEGEDGEVYGDAVNIASGIRGVAEAGQVVLSQATLLTVQQAVAMEADDLGEFELKGVKDPIRLYSIRLEEVVETTGLREQLEEAIAPLQLLEVGDRGGMGEIYLARDPGLRRTLAVKVLRSELVTDAEARSRFQREATVIAGLSHPNVITIHSVGELEDGTPYFVMDYVEGGSLADRLEEEGPLSVTEARRILGEVASALQAAHAKGIVHRDIKAANILWDLESGRALVTDWGIAALDPTVDVAPETRLTRTGTFIGSPQYMSPEQLAGDEVGPETDLYGLGLLAFELLTGHGPFAAETPREIMISHLREDPESLAKLRYEVDSELDSLVARCLSKNPDERPLAAEVAKRLQAPAGMVLEWPPPGLDELMGRGGPVSRRLLVASVSVTVAVALFYYVMYFPDGGLRLSVLAGLLALAGLVGAVWFVRDIAGIGVRVMEARRAGYDWPLILDVLADRRGDAGSVISGTREYAELPQPLRSRLRLYRRAVVLWQLFAGAGLLALHLVLLRIGDFWTAGSWFLLLLLLLLPLAYMDTWEARKTRDSRRRLTRTRRREIFLVAPWYDTLSLISSRERRPDTARHPRSSLVLAVLVSACVLMATAIILPYAWLGFTGKMVEEDMGRALAGMRDRAARWHQVAEWRELALEARVPGSEDGGPLLWAVMRAHRDPDFLFDPSFGGLFREPPVELPTWDALPPPGQLFLTASGERVGIGMVQDSLLSRTARHLTPDQVEWIRDLTTHPQLDAFSQAARSESLDLFTASFDPSALPSWSGAILPLPYDSRVLSTFGALKHMRAALFVHAGDLPSAEGELLEVLSIGFHLRDNAVSVFSQSLGQMTIMAALAGLRDLYSLMGRPEAEAIDATLRSLDTPDADLPGTNLSQALERLSPFGRAGPTGRAMRIFRADARGLPGLQWEVVTVASMLGECGSLEGIVSGPDNAVRYLMRSAAESLATTPSREAYLRRISESVLPERDSRDLWLTMGIPIPLTHRLPLVTEWFEFVGWVTGNPRVPRCFAYQVIGDIYGAIY